MSAHTIDLSNAKTLTVTPAEDGDLVEIRSAEGQIELRVKVTAEGPVLQMESVRLSLKASESVNVDCKNFEVRATESVDMHSDGGMQISGQADIRVDANGNVIVKGETIYLN
jgi:phage gp45-like